MTIQGTIERKPIIYQQYDTQTAKPNSKECFCSDPHLNHSHLRWARTDAYMTKNNHDVHIAPDWGVLGSIYSTSFSNTGYSFSVVITYTKVPHPNGLDTVG